MKYCRTIIIAVLFLSLLSGNVLFEKYCGDSIISEGESLLSSHDITDSSNCADEQNCGCHCHHLDFTALAESSNLVLTKVDIFPFNLASLLPIQKSPSKKPPKIVS